MRRRSIVRAPLALGLALGLASCGALPAGPDTGADDYLGETLSLGEARILPVVAESTTRRVTTLHLAEDLLTTASEDAELSIDPAQLVVQMVPSELAKGRHSQRGSRNGSAQVTFRFAAADQDPCASDRVVGPFTLTIKNGRVHFEPSKKALTRAVRDLLRLGVVSVCVEMVGDFDGTVFLREVSFTFGSQGDGDKTNKVEICHRRRGGGGDDKHGDGDHRRDNDDRRHDDDGQQQGGDDRRNNDEDRGDRDGVQWHTIRVGLAAVPKHLAHGDQMGPCESNEGPSDADGDAVTDDLDACPNTPGGEVVDSTGCSCSQTDSDADGVNDCADTCADTAAGQSANADGCSCGQLDDDSDQVSNCHDGCPHTPAGEAPDGAGCSCSQRDGDGDSVADCTDACTNTPAGEQVDPTGCTIIIVAADAGPNTAAVEGDIVSINGTGSVVQGPYDPALLLHRWEQTGGSSVGFRDDLLVLVVDTTGVVGDLAFRLTTSTADGSIAANDDVVISVRPANIVHAAAGTWHNAILYENNRARLWGWNRHQELGDGSILRDVVSVDAGLTFTLFAKTDGTAWVLGTSVLGTFPTPVQIAGVDEVVQVAAVAQGGLLRRADGSVWGFVAATDRTCVLGNAVGSPVNGVLGPVAIPGLPGNIVQIATGGQHTVALGADGQVWVWGGARYGCAPFAALSNVAAVDAGETNLCLFLRTDGSAWAMGYNFYGQLGNGSNTSNYRTPTQVLGMTDVAAVAAGSLHSLFAKRDGTVWSSGWNHDCQLGLGSGVGVSVRVPSQVLLTGAALIAGGSSHSATIGADNSIWAWGMNNVGQLTGGTATASPGSSVCSPTEIQFP